MLLFTLRETTHIEAALQEIDGQLRLQERTHHEVSHNRCLSTPVLVSTTLLKFCRSWDVHASMILLMLACCALIRRYIRVSDWSSAAGQSFRASWKSQASPLSQWSLHAPRLLVPTLVDHGKDELSVSEGKNDTGNAPNLSESVQTV